MKMPNSLKNTFPVIVFWLVLFIFSGPAQAAIDNVGMLDNILERYSTAASSWADVITEAASWLFWTLTLISMVWTFGMMALRKADIAEFFAEFIRFTIFTGFFWWLLTNGPNFASSIYDSLRQLAGNATGLGDGLSPSGIIDVGFAIFGKVIDKSSIWSPVDSLAGIIIACIILVILALVSINMLLLLCSAWVLAYAGVFFLGFGGSRWTSDMAINYYKTVLGVATQLMTMVLLIGIGKTFLDDYYTQMSQGITLKEMGVLMITAITLFALVDKLPPLLSGIITGASVGNIGIGAFGAGAAFAAAGMAGAATSTAGAALAGGMANAAGGASAVKSAFSKASQNVAAGNDVLSRIGGKSKSGGSDDKASGSSKTPFAQAAGFAGRIVADAGANLAQGTGSVAKSKASNLKQSAANRISETTGSKISAAIKGAGDSDSTT